jgi:hypothetical protein
VTDITAGQYQITRSDGSNAFAYGFGANGIQVASTQTDTGTINVQDQAVTGHDGMLFGIDTLPGMVITQTGYAYTSPATGQAALNAYSALAAAWNDPVVRLAYGSVQILRAFYQGAAGIRRCYGRGRKIMPAYGQVFQGLVPFTSQFQCADNTWYSDAAYSVTLTNWGSGASGLGTAGLLLPNTPPFPVPARPYTSGGVISNAGTLPTWPVFTFTGPLANPSVAYTGTPVAIGWSGTLNGGQTLVIDTRPWARTALIGGASAAGALTGSAMIAMQAQPGATQVAFTASRPYSTTTPGTCVIQWRNATLAIGGST